MVYLEFILKSLIPTRKILSPSYRGRLPVYRGCALRLLVATKRTHLSMIFLYRLYAVKKRDLLLQISFYTLDRVEKKTHLAMSLFIPLKKVEKKANPAVDFFIPPSGFEPLLRE